MATESPPRAEAASIESALNIAPASDHHVSFSVAAYEKVLLIRTSEEAIVSHYPEDEMKTPMHMSMGQEAVPAGVCLALGDEAQIFATYRSHAAFLARTEDPVAFFGELYGKVIGPGRGKGGSMHLALPGKGHMASSAIVGSCLPLAVGAAFAFKSRGDAKVSCVFFGDGALDEGGFWESLNVACVMRLPVLFVCEDNDWAVHTAREHRAGYDSITAVVRQMRCVVDEADTNDVETIAALTTRVMEQAKAQSSPAFLKLKCCRYLEHVGINCDLSAGYRTAESVERWRQMDAVRLQRARLGAHGLTEAQIGGIEMKIKSKVEDAVRAAKNAALPLVDELWDAVLA